MQESKPQKTSSGLRKERIIPDYTGDRYWASVLAKRLQVFWQKLGYTSVRAWVEVEDLPSGSKIFSVRSNLAFDCNSLRIK